MLGKGTKNKKTVQTRARIEKEKKSEVFMKVDGLRCTTERRRMLPNKHLYLDDEVIGPTQYLFRILEQRLDVLRRQCGLRVPQRRRRPQRRHHRAHRGSASHAWWRRHPRARSRVGPTCIFLVLARPAARHARVAHPMRLGMRKGRWRSRIRALDDRSARPAIHRPTVGDQRKRVRGAARTA